MQVLLSSNLISKRMHSLYAISFTLYFVTKIKISRHIILYSLLENVVGNWERKMIHLQLAFHLIERIAKSCLIVSYKDVLQHAQLNTLYQEKGIMWVLSGSTGVA